MLITTPMGDKWDLRADGTMVCSKWPKTFRWKWDATAGTLIITRIRNDKWSNVPVVTGWVRELTEAYKAAIRDVVISGI